MAAMQYVYGWNNMGHLFVKHVPIVFLFIIQQTTTAIEHYFITLKEIVMCF